jgi:aromatic ring-opening dioxygenase catalytic subunit (LigB family)
MSEAQRLPAVYLPHGGGPWPFVKIGIGDEAEQAHLAKYLRGISHLPKKPPRALLVISAHWEEANPTVMNGAHPPMLYDYYGFPKESYELTWPAPGEPVLAQQVRELLEGAGFSTGADSARGFDHGTFVPLKLAYPNADVPTVQLSLKQGLDPKEHLAMGRALAPLREQGVFIIGSGMSYHNLRAFGAEGRPAASAFDAWLRESMQLGAKERDARLADWQKAPSARAVHPREEHLLPLMVVAGAAGNDRGRMAFHGSLAGLEISAYDFGAN